MATVTIVQQRLSAQHPSIDQAFSDLLAIEPQINDIGAAVDALNNLMEGLDPNVEGNEGLLWIGRQLETLSQDVSRSHKRSYDLFRHALYGELLPDVEGGR